MCDRTKRKWLCVYYNVCDYLSQSSLCRLSFLYASDGRHFRCVWHCFSSNKIWLEILCSLTDCFICRFILKLCSVICRVYLYIWIESYFLQGYCFYENMNLSIAKLKGITLRLSSLFFWWNANCTLYVHSILPPHCILLNLLTFMTS